MIHENNKRITITLPKALIEKLSQVNKYNLNLSKQIEIIIVNYLTRNQARPKQQEQQQEQQEELTPEQIKELFTSLGVKD